MGNSSAVSAGDGNHWHISGASGKRNVGSVSARNSLSHRIDVFGLRSSKQGRKRKIGIVELVGIVNMSAIIRGVNFSDVLITLR